MDHNERTRIEHDSVSSTKHVWSMTPDNELIWVSRAAIGHSNILELGCFNGRTALILQASSGGKVVTVDNCSDWQWENRGSPYHPSRAKIQERFKNKPITFIEGQFTDETVEKVRPFGPFDMVFIDDDHSYEGVKRALLQSKKVRTPDALVCGHDLDNPHTPGVRQALEELHPNRFCQTTGWMWVAW